MKPKVLSLFSGVGGFDIGLERAGMQTAFQCEWDKHATSILEKHWSDVPRWGDISTLTGEHILSVAPQIDVVAWGSPCQDLSVAGKRAGLKGERSGLFHEGIRIIKEIRELTNGKYPRVSIWENVAGALSSSDGADFGQVLYEMDEAGACFSEWRLLDAQYFGVPQRRRRVFVVSVFDSSVAGRCPNPLLPVSEGVHWYPSAGGAKRKETSGASEQGAKSGSGEATAILMRMREGKDGGGKGPLLSEDKSLTVATANDQTLFIQPIGFSHTQGLSAQPSEEAFPTLRTEGAGMAVALNSEPTVFQPGTMVRLGGGVWEGTVPTLRAEVKRGDNEPHIMTEPTMSVRRLTPLECERLMGWNDDHTRWKSDGTEQADTHRYKQCGNGVASPVAEWIGQQIMAVLI